jgi:hypothetical protein
MKRATITITDDLEAAVAAFQRDQEVPPALTAVAQAALREYLTERGYLSPRRALRVTPAERGSGASDVSEHHDRYLARR